MNQTTFVEPARRPRRVKTPPAKLATKFSTLADWYIANKPAVRVLRISKDDHWSLQQAWLANQIECRKNGFACKVSAPNKVTAMSFRGFELVENV